MKSTPASLGRLGIALGCLAVLAGTAMSKPELAPTAPLMMESGATLAADTFATSLPKTWRPLKGKWEASDGAVRGREIPAEKHGAVMRRALPFTNAIITFSFRLDHAKQISVSINDAKEHVCRVLINPRGFVVQKDDHDHTGPDKAVVFARVPMTIAPGEWHTAIVELNGAEMLAQVDGPQHVGFGAHALLDQPKANFGFTVAGGPAEFRDVSIKAATPRADWPETKKQLAAK